MTPAAGEEVAAVADRLAALLAAGLTPSAAWRHLAGLEDSPVVGAAARAAEAGTAVSAAIAAAAASAGVPPAWRAVGAGIAVAERTGAALAGVLEHLAASLRDEAAAQRDVLAALTGPRMSARLVMALPVVGVAFGYALGFDPLAALAGTPLGLACGAGGATLFALGWLWTRQLVRRARPPEAWVGLGLELVAVALAAGAPYAAAVAVVREVGAASGLDLEDRGAEGIARLAASAGAPVGALLKGEARLCRRYAASDARVRAESLGVTLLLPLGICVLPSFMLLSVAPLLLSIVGSTLLPV